jgi:hypothetical protein
VTWVKLDDGFPESPKVIGLSDKAFRVHVRALCYCSQHLTDGWVPSAKALEWGAKSVAELIDARLWLPHVTGYAIHDFLDYNPSSESVKNERRKARERRANGGKRSGDVRANVMNPDPTRPDPTPKPPKAEPPSAVFDQGKWQHLLETLWTHGYVSEGAGALTWKFVMGCMHRYGVPVVDSALSDASLSDASPLGSSAKYFESICVRFSEAQSA